MNTKARYMQPLASKTKSKLGAATVNSNAQNVSPVTSSTTEAKLRAELAKLKKELASKHAAEKSAAQFRDYKAATEAALAERDAKIEVLEAQRKKLLNSRKLVQKAADEKVAEAEERAADDLRRAEIEMEELREEAKWNAQRVLELQQVLESAGIDPITFKPFSAAAKAAAARALEPLTTDKEEEALEKDVEALAIALEQREQALAAQLQKMEAAEKQLKAIKIPQLSK